MSKAQEEEIIEINAKLPILFLWNKSYGAYFPNTYCQVSFSRAMLKNKPTYDKFPSTFLWVGRTWTEYNDSWFRTIRYIREEELQSSNIIGTLVYLENAEEIIDVEDAGTGREFNLLRLSLTTKERVRISDISSAPDGFYYGRYETYDDLPMTEQEKVQALNIIEEIKEKYVALKLLKPEAVQELEFLIQLQSQTIEEYVSSFSLDSINIYKEHDINYLHELFTTQSVVLRLQGILLQLDLLIGKNN